METMIIDQNKIVTTFVLRTDDVKANFEEISKLHKLTPFMENINECWVATTDKNGNESGLFNFLYDEKQKLFSISGIGPLDSIDYYLRADLVLNDKRKEMLNQSGIDLTTAKAYYTALDDLAWGHLITDGKTEVFLCTNITRLESDVLFDELYTIEELIPFYKKLLF